MYCKKCKKEVKDNSIYCGYCGYKFNKTNSMPYKAAAPREYAHLNTAPHPKHKGNIKKVVLSVLILAIAITILFIVYQVWGNPFQREKKDSLTEQKTEQRTDIFNGESEKTTISEKHTIEEPVEMKTALPIPKENIKIDNHFLTATSTSHLSSIVDGDKVYDYYPSKLIDGDTSTAWCEGVSGYGVGESVTINISIPKTVSGLIIYGGLCKNDTTFKKNARPKEIKIKLSNNVQRVVTLSDGFKNQPSVINFENPIETQQITLEIVSFYPGDVYEDTCISEVMLF